jgi:7-keto-8-aminopelargonate synthetase-like enzyme
METIDFAGNDYLGLARDPRLVETLCKTAKLRGISATSSRWALGWSDIHQQLEENLADFFGTEAACIMGAAYFGGIAYFDVLGKTKKVAYCDRTCHSNLFYGMRATGFDIRTFEHLDASDCAAHLKDHTGTPPVVATDGVYGISGEVAPLAELSRAARSAGAELLIDDAHGVFALGDNGGGSSELCGIDPGEATIIGSMSKALGCSGGFLAGRRELVEQFRRAQGPSGSAIPPAPIAAACLEALRILQKEPQLREKMWSNAKRMKQVLQNRGINVVADGTPIVAMRFADEFEAAAAAEHLAELGLRMPYFKYASEPRENMLRAAARACYTEEHLNRFEEAVDALNLGGYAYGKEH